MPRVHHVKSARKPQKAHGIKKGDSYYWWKFKLGGKCVSKTPPRRSQLTRSEFYATLWDIEDGMVVAPEDELEDVASALESAAEEVRQLGEDCGGKADSLDSAFPNGCPSLELLRERQEACDQLADNLDSAAQEVRDLADDEELKTADDRAQQVEDLVSGVDWSID